MPPTHQANQDFPRFRIATLLWLTALLASAMGAFGPGWGIAAAFAAMLFWSAWLQRPRLKGVEWLVVACILAILIGLLMPAISTPRTTARWSSCANNMKLIALALQLYDSGHGKLPPAYSTDKEGDPLHSWRALLLPYIEWQPLHEAIDHEMAWDDPVNTKCTTTEIELFVCPDHWRNASSGAASSYQIVTGPGTLWPAGGPSSLSEIPDGADTTLLLIEVAPTTPWAKPSSLTLDEAVDLLTSPIDPEANGGHRLAGGYYEKPAIVRNVAMADSAVYRLRGPLPERVARALLTADGGESITKNDLLPWEGHELDYAKIIRQIFFLLVASLPAFRKRESVSPSDDALVVG